MSTKKNTTVAANTNAKPHRLNAQDKLLLKQLAAAKVKQWTDAARKAAEPVIAKGKSEMAKIIEAIVSKRTKDSDLKVLERFGMTRTISEFNVFRAWNENDAEGAYYNYAKGYGYYGNYYSGDQTPDCKPRSVRLDRNIKVPRTLLVPGKFNDSDSERRRIDGNSVILTADQWNKFIGFEPKVTLNKIAEEAQNRLTAYGTLIAQAKNFEQVVEVWPEAEELRTQICGLTPLALVPDNVRDIIANDMAERSRIKALPAPAMNPANAIAAE